MKTLLISQDQIKALISTKEIVDSVEKTFQGLGEGTVINPTKVNLNLGETGGYPHFEGYMNAMPAYVEWAGAAGLKWAGGFLGERQKKGLPYITSLIMMIDPRTGEFTSVMDGAYITNMRTGAQTAVALQYIMPADKKSLRLGLYGAGMQGRTQIMAIAQRFEIEEVTVYDVVPQAAEDYARTMKEYVSGQIKVAATPREAAVGDAIITVTQAQDKFLEEAWVAPGTVIFPMGSHQECSNELILSCDKIIVDHIGQALHRGALADLNAQGKVLEDNIFATIGELAAGKKEARLGAGQRFVCVPIGTGCMDVGIASIVQKKALAQGLGGSFEFV